MTRFGDLLKVLLLLYTIYRFGDHDPYPPPHQTENMRQLRRWGVTSSSFSLTQRLHRRQLPTATSFTSLQYAFTNASCQIGYFLPNITTSSKNLDDRVMSPTFRMTTTTTTAIDAPTTITRCVPTIGIGIPMGNKAMSNLYSNGDNHTGVTGAVVSQFNVQAAISLLQQQQQQLRRTEAVDDKSHGDPKNEISLELWIRVPVQPPLLTTIIGGDVEKTVAVLTIQRPHGVNATVANSGIERNDATRLSNCEEKHVDLQVSYSMNAIHQHWTLTMRTSPKDDTDSPFEPCRTIAATDTNRRRRHHQNHELIHVLISIQDRRQLLYINGQPLLTLQESLHISTDWHSDSIIHLLSSSSYIDPAVDDSFSLMTLYQFSVHSTALGNDSLDVQNLILYHTLPSTSPWAYNQSTLVYEDAEAIPGSHYNDNESVWYQTAPSPKSLNDTAYLNGPYIMDINRDVQELMQDPIVNQNSTTAAVALPRLPPIYMYIIELPRLGQLYFCDDSTTANPMLLLSSMDSSPSVFIPVGMYDSTIPRLKYIPPQNAISYPNTYTTVRYCIADSDIFNVHQCQSSATVNIVIVPVNDPPIAVAVPKTIRAPEARRSTTNDTNATHDRYYPHGVPKIRLYGSDVDLDDAIVEIQLVHAPQRGYLSMVVTSFRHDWLWHGTRLYENMLLETNGEPVYVEYTFDRSMGNSTNLIVQNNNVKDYFTYRVKDRQGWWSLVEQVEIQVTSSLLAWADPIVRMNEDSTQLLHWYGSDVSIRNRQRVQFYVENVPSEEVGMLLHPQSNATISRPGMIILDSPIYMNEIKIFFQSSRNFCHTNNINTTPLGYDNVIRFRIVSLTSNDTTTTKSTFFDSVSDPFTQQIWIECTLDILEFQVPENLHHTIIASSLQRTTTDPCHAQQWIKNQSNSPQVNATLCRTAAFIAGMTLTSIDHKAAMVTISITTKLGMITLHPHYWNLSDPLLGRFALSAGTITFQAIPDDATTILSNLHYQSYVTGNDTIEITAVYGSCTVDEQFEQFASAWSSNRSYRTATCQVLRRSIPIAITPDPDYHERYGKWHVQFPWSLLLCLFGYPVLYVAWVHLEMWWYGVEQDRGDRLGNPEEEEEHDTTTLRSDTRSQSDMMAERYIQHEDADGMIYFEDTATGNTHWSVPSLPQPEQGEEEKSHVRGREII